MTIAENEVESIEELHVPEDRDRPHHVAPTVTGNPRPEIAARSSRGQRSILNALATAATSAGEGETQDHLYEILGRKYVNATEDESCLTHEAPTSQSEARLTTRHLQPNVERVAVLRLREAIIRNRSEGHRAVHHD